MLIGFHYSISGKTNGEVINELEKLNKKKKIGVFQIFLQSPRFVKATLRKFTDDDIEKFKGKTFKLIIHMPYAINLHSPYYSSFQIENTLLQFVKRVNDVNKGMVLGIVIHTPSLPKEYSKREALTRMVNNIGELSRFIDFHRINTKIYLETLARTTLIKHFDFNLFYKKITEKYGKEIFNNIAFCLDTAHVFNEGALSFEKGTVKKFIKKFRETYGYIEDFIGVLHLNNTTTNFESGHDIHTSISTGKIPEKELLKLARICYKKKIPIILERSKYSFDENVEETQEIKKKLLIKKKINKIK